MKRGFVFLTVLAIAAMLLAGCASSATPSQFPETTPTPSPSTQPASSGPSTGTITVLVTDAPSYQVDNVTVYFSRVEVHKAADGPDGEGGWIEIPLDKDVDDQTFFEEGGIRKIDLNADMGEVVLAQSNQVEAGTKYTQIRVYMDENYENHPVEVTYHENVNDEAGDSQIVPAKLPSGTLKFVRPFVVDEGEETRITLDFNLQDSVVFTGSKKDINVIVKPVVKLSVSEKGKPAKLEATLDTTGEAEAELSTEIKHTGRDSVHLKTTGTEEPGDEARIVIPLPEGTTLGKIESISWWTYLVGGYIPHVDLVLDYDEDANRDDVLVAEAAHQNDNDATTWKDSYKGEDVGWIETFEGASGVYTSWAMSGNCGDVKCMNGETAVWMVAANDLNFGLDTLTNFQTTTGKTDGSITINEETAVLALEIEIDNWIYQSEAYVDDIEVIIDGVTYKVHL